jgi:PPOX class probable F420-dependent enzyme
MPALSQDAKNLIDRPNFAHIATLMSDGSPQSTTVWISRDDDQIILSTTEGSLMSRNIQRDPRVSISINDFADPYMELQIRGRIIERRPDPGLSVIDAISHKYIGKPFPMRHYKDRVIFLVAVEKEKYTKLPLEHTPPK